MSIKVTRVNWDQEVNMSAIPVLVDFWAKWCAPCKALAPILSELAIEFENKIKIVSVDVEEDMQLAKEHGVSSLPTMIMFVNGVRASDKIVGAMRKEAIKMILEKYEAK